MTRDESVEKENERKWGNVHLGKNSFLGGEEYSELPLGRGGSCLCGILPTRKINSSETRDDLDYYYTTLISLTFGSLGPNFRVSHHRPLCSLPLSIHVTREECLFPKQAGRLGTRSKFSSYFLRVSVATCTFGKLKMK